jgi:putative transposase
VPLRAVARSRAIPYRTLQTWLARYRQAGLAGLVPAPRADRGHRRFPAPLIQLIEGLALRRPRPSAASIHRQVVGVAMREGWPVPSYRTVAAVVSAIDPALATLAHDGAKVYHERFDLLFRREAERPNAIWQADHTQLDCWVRDEHDRPVKPWLTVILDDYSRVVSGYRLGLTASTAIQTALALRDAIWRKAEPAWHVCGIPDVFYTDHGSDFISHHLEQVALDLRMQLVFSTAGVPRGRGKIERFFQTISQLFLCTQPGYAPRGLSPHGTALLTLSQLDQRLRAFLIQNYHQRVHSETNQPPQARWDAGGFLPRMPASLEQLDLLLLTVATPRLVRRDGIHVHGLRYLDLTLVAYVGETVTIRYDPRDLAEIRVYYGDGFLCRAVCPELAGSSVTLKELVQARRQRQRALDAGLTQRARLVELLLEQPPDAGHPIQPADMTPAVVPAAPRPRLKRYINE